MHPHIKQVFKDLSIIDDWAILSKYYYNDQINLYLNKKKPKKIEFKKLIIYSNTYKLQFKMYWLDTKIAKIIKKWKDPKRS